MPEPIQILIGQINQTPPLAQVLQGKTPDVLFGEVWANLIASQPKVPKLLAQADISESDISEDVTQDSERVVVGMPLPDNVGDTNATLVSPVDPFPETLVDAEALETGDATPENRTVPDLGLASIAKTADIVPSVGAERNVMQASRNAAPAHFWTAQVPHATAIVQVTLPSPAENQTGPQSPSAPQAETAQMSRAPALDMNPGSAPNSAAEGRLSPVIPPMARSELPSAVFERTATETGAELRQAVAQNANAQPLPLQARGEMAGALLPTQAVDPRQSSRSARSEETTAADKVLSNSPPGLAVAQSKVPTSSLALLNAVHDRLAEDLARSKKESLAKDMIGQTAPGSANTTSPALSQTFPTPGAAADVARQIGHQMAVVVSQTKAGTTELALNPKELGRVRLTLTAQDNVLVLSIMAERIETSDLMRRHIDQLSQEFRDLGYRDIHFSFGSRGGSSHNQGGGTVQAGTDLLADEAPDSHEHPRPSARSSGLDLRI